MNDVADNSHVPQDVVETIVWLKVALAEHEMIPETHPFFYRDTATKKVYESLRIDGRLYIRELA